MKTFFLYIALAFLVAGCLADGFHGRRGHGRQSRRRPLGRRNNFFRRGRQDESVSALNEYGAPAIDPVPLDDPLLDPIGADYPEDYVDADVAPALSSYGVGGNGNGIGNGIGNGNGNGNGNGIGFGDDNIAMLEKAVPGVPGQDYPIYASVPETAFSCNGQIDGGYYADPEAQCQVFHICTADGFGGLAKYSFLCPNGTIFNQNYFICDWWFNFDCSQAEALYIRNEEIRAEQEANIGAVAPADNGAAINGLGPLNGGLDDYDYGLDDLAPLDPIDTDVGITEAPLGLYGAPEAVTELPDIDAAARAARRFRAGRRGRARSSRRNNRRNNRRNHRNRFNRRGRRFQG